MKRLLSIVMCCMTGWTWGQSAFGSLHVLSVSTPEERTIHVHRAVLPLIRQTDTLLRYSSGNNEKRRHIRFLPTPEVAFQYDTALFYRAAAGCTMIAEWGKWYAKTTFTGGWSTREGINQTHVAFTPVHNRDAFIFSDIRARVAFTPNKYLHVAAGIDQQFFGEGYRSLFQSDQSTPAPFALMRVNLRFLEYGLVYQFLHENDPTHQNRLWKFGAMHYLSANITKNWNVGLIETVFFQQKDGTFNRSFEVEYLNPIIFFRPQEYSIGSSDNVLVGLQTSYAIRKHTLYGQLLMDEFVLKEIRSRSRWWANKYGAQLGIKGSIAHYNYRLEGNLMRPYVYAHINDGQNGGNQGRPLAHPLGSNFVELLAQLQTNYTKVWNWTGYVVFQLKGYDEQNISWGGDIYQSYNNRPKEYGHTIGQGITARTIRVGAEIRYGLRNNFSVLYVDAQIATSWGDISRKTVPALTAGWRSVLFQERRTF